MKNRICAATTIPNDGLFPEEYKEAVIKEQEIKIARKLIEDLRPGEEVIFQGPQIWAQRGPLPEELTIKSESHIESLTRCRGCKKWTGNEFVERGICRKIVMAPVSVIQSISAPGAEMLVTSRDDFCSWAEPIE